MLRVMGKPVGKTPWLGTPEMKATKFCVFAYAFFLSNDPKQNDSYTCLCCL